MTSKYPLAIDDDSSLIPISDNLSELGGEAINDLRDAVFNIETEVGIGGSGTSGSIANRIAVALNPDGSIKSSAIASLGLVTLPITNSQIAPAAGIPESKLSLDHPTQDLFNLIQGLSGNIDTALGWISVTGIKLEPHIFGLTYRHTLSQIDVVLDPSLFLKNKFRTFRNNNDSFQLINDINNELLDHQFADGSPDSAAVSIITKGGSKYPSNYAHTASGIFLDTSRFATVPQTAQDVQQFADFIDNASIFLLGTRIQNLYSNGISRSSRSSSLNIDGYGAPVVPETPAIAHLLNNGLASSPVDDIDVGDDIIEFKPSSADMSSNAFDAKFVQVKVGDIVRINYGTVEVQFVIKEKKYIQNAGNKKYIIRIAGKNLFYSPNAIARIDRPLFNNNKFGVLSAAAANNNFSGQPSLIIGNPRGAQALGLGFDPDLFDVSHYLLYLVIYPTGNPVDGFTVLPAIDITGNRGTTSGKYTLDSIVEATNNAFRQPGFNYRFTAFSYQGEFGIMLADSYNNTGFSIINGVVASDGSFDLSATGINFPNNVVGLSATGTLVPADPLGFGINGANIASPQFTSSYGSAEAASLPTKLFLPLKRNNYYVNGVEKEKLNIDVFQLLDKYGDGYWEAIIQNKTVFPGPSGRVQVTYRVPLDLSTSNLKVGKTIVVQSLGQGDLVDFGRFIIQGINISCPPNPFTDITVYDAVHGSGVSPAPTLDIGKLVAVYFDSDSVSFNEESATDFSSVSPFKRHFEIYVDSIGNTFTHERSRINISGSTMTIDGTVSLYSSTEIAKLNIIKISPKLRGYQFGPVNKITLHILDLNTTTGIFSGQLTSYDGVTYSKKGPLTSGRIGEVVRFYDETNLDFIEVLYDANITISNFSDLPLDFQLFPTLSLDEEIMLLGTCQVNDVTNIVNYIRDERQFGNTSEKDFTTSALNFISLPERILNSSGVVRGFDLSDASPNPNSNQIYLTGGMALVDGKFIQIDNATVAIPILKESNVSLFDINWALCVNDKGEYQPIPLLDFDPVLSTPTNSSRQFQAFNPVTSAKYFLDATTFTNLIENRKDLAVLYIASSTVDATVSPPTISLNITDARKYVNDSDANFPIILTSDNVQGNFYSLSSVLTWLKYNNTFNTHVIVRGTFNITSPEVFDFSNVQQQIIFEGDGAVFNVQVDLGITLGSFVKFKNIHFIHDFVPSPALTSADFVNVGHGLMYSTIGTNQLLTDVAIEDCTFSVTGNGSKYSYIHLLISDGSAIINNLTIKNNKFKVSLDPDFNAAISIINVCQVGPNIPKLINAVIEGNICDSEQMIIVTTKRRGGIIIDPGIACVGVRISKNICGTISAMGTSSASGTLLYNKETDNIITIENNICRYISDFDETGKYVEAFSIASNIVNITNDTGNKVIKGNKCAFIHTGIHGLFSSIVSLRILENHLTSNIVSGTAHSADYLSNFNYPVDNKRFAIYVSASPTAGGLNHIIIDKNKTDGIVVGSKTGYESFIRTCAAANITNNYLENIFTAPVTSDPEYSAIIYDGYTAGIISNNFISRLGASSIYAYIASRFDVSIIPSNYAEVVDNILNTSTIDGTSEVIAKDGAATPHDLTDFWLIERNKNQIKSILLSLSDAESTFNYNVTTFSPTTVSPIFEAPVGLGSTKVNFANAPIASPNLIITEKSLDYKNYFKYFSLDSRLPPGVTVISAKIGIWLSNGNFINSGTPSTFELDLVSNLKYDDVLDVKTNTSGINTSTTSTLTVDGITITNAIMNASTNYVEVLPSLTGPYRTGGTYSLGLAFNALYAQDTVSPSFLLFYVSPIKVKFKW